MARGAQSAVEARSGGSANNGGGFCYSGPTYPTDLASTNGNTATPTVTSASYTFVAGDAGNWLYVKSGTNWTPGLYQIASVAAGAATLSRAVGTAATLSGGNWSVDYTQQNAAQFSGTDLAVDATTNTIVRSATHTFTPADVGSWIRVSAGTGFTVSWYQINSVASGAATLDSSPAAVGTTGGTWALGGAVLLATMPSCMVANNQGYVKDGGWATMTAGISFSQVATGVGSTSPPTLLSGYTTTRRDGGQVSLTLGTNSNITAIATSGNGFHIEGFNINCSSLTGSVGISISGGANVVRNCKVSNAKSAGIQFLQIQGLCHHCEATGCSGGNGALYFNAGGGSGDHCTCYGCWAHDNTCTGILKVGDAYFYCIDNVSSNNSGASSDGIQLLSIMIVLGNTVYNNGRHGINLNTSGMANVLIRNNIIANHTAVGAGGLSVATAAFPAMPSLDGNFYYNNSTHRLNADDCNPTANSNSTYINPVYLSGPYINSLDVFLTATPFTNAATNDFTLNNNAGGGAAVRGKGYPGVGGKIYSGIPGLTSLNGYRDGGLFQHQDAGGSVSTVVNKTTNIWINNLDEFPVESIL